MKKLFFVIPVILLVFFADCKKAKGPANVDSIQPDNGIDSVIFMNTFINGREWKTDSAFSYKVKYSGNDSGVINLLIEATQKKPGDTSTISININNYIGPATYLVNPPINAIYYYSGNVRHIATSGSFIVTADTGQVLRGTFSFVADTVKVTAGTFKVALP